MPIPTLLLTYNFPFADKSPFVNKFPFADKSPFAINFPVAVKSPFITLSPAASVEIFGLLTRII